MTEHARLIRALGYAEQIAARPELVAIAREAIDTVVAQGDATMGQLLWQKLLREPLDTILRGMTSGGPEGRLLRSNNPFSLIVDGSGEALLRQTWREACEQLRRLYAEDRSERPIEPAPSPLRTDVPSLNVPRWWSNPGLEDPATIVALVLDSPTTEDLATTLAHYGIEFVAGVRDQTDGERSPEQNRLLADMWVPIVQGVRDALARP